MAAVSDLLLRGPAAIDSQIQLVSVASVCVLCIMVLAPCKCLLLAMVLLPLSTASAPALLERGCVWLHCATDISTGAHGAIMVAMPPFSNHLRDAGIAGCTHQGRKPLLHTKVSR